MRSMYEERPWWCLQVVHTCRQVTRTSVTEWATNLRAHLVCLRATVNNRAFLLHEM